MNYAVERNGLVKVVTTKPVDFRDDHRYLKVKAIILDFCQKNKRIPTIEEYNNYQRRNLLLNEYLIEYDLRYSNFIQSLKIKETTKGVYRVNEVKMNFNDWLISYKKKHGFLPSYKEASEKLAIISEEKIVGQVKKDFLKSFGIKLQRKGRTYKRYNAKGKEEALKIVEGLLEEDTFVFVAKKNERHVIKFSE